MIPITIGQALSILELAGKYGVPALTNILKEWNEDIVLTPDVIRQLETKFKDPETYFEDKLKTENE